MIVKLLEFLFASLSNPHPCDKCGTGSLTVARPKHDTQRFWGCTNFDDRTWKGCNGTRRL